jgi:hypothetical protein
LQRKKEKQTPDHYQLTTLFQGSLKTEASRHNCGDTHPKKQFSTIFRKKILKEEFVTEYSVLENSVAFRRFFAKKKEDCLGVVYIEKRIQYWDQAGVKNSKIPNTEIG